MTPVKFEGHDVVLKPPKDWDARKNGECCELPIMVDRGCVISCWEPTDEERHAIANGANIYLRVFGGQPPVELIVGRAKA
jgi:hypothetical protein